MNATTAPGPSATRTARPPEARATTDTTETLDTFFSLWRHLIPSDGVSLTAASTLGLLLRSGAMRLTALAEREAISQPAMTGLISRLQAAGLVIRHPDPLDGRAVLVDLTASGRARIEDRRARRAAEVEGLLGLLEPGERASIDAAIPALRRLIDHAAQHHHAQAEHHHAQAEHHHAEHHHTEDHHAKHAEAERESR